MTLDLDDQAMAHRLRAELEGATYDRPTTSFLQRSRTPLVAGMGCIAAAAVAATAIGGFGSPSPALAWSPTPTAATAADEDAATAACSADLNTESDRSGNAPPPPLLELPPLVTLDLRGTGGLATFADENMSFTCLLIREGDGFQRGPLIGEPTDSNSNSDALQVVAATSTEWSDGTTISMMTGVAPAVAATVTIDIAGQPTATATVNGGRFAMWWFGTVENLDVSATALDADGNELARTDIGREPDDSSGTQD